MNNNNDNITRLNILEEKTKTMKNLLAENSKEIDEFIKYGKLIYLTDEGKQFFNLAYKLFVRPTEDKLAFIEKDNQFLLGKLTGEYKMLKCLVIPFINNIKKE